MSSNVRTQKQYIKWQKTMRFFSKVFQCHQLSDRSFHFNGYQFPLCARCTGIYLGLVLGIIPCIFYLYNVFVSLVFMLIMVYDGYTQLKGKRTSDNFLRFVTGMLFGYGVTSLVFAAIRFFVSF